MAGSDAVDFAGTTDRWRLRTPVGLDLRGSYQSRLRWRKWVAACSGPATAVIGLLGLLGWLFSIQVLQSPVSSWITIKVNTSIVLIALGLSWLLLYFRRFMPLMNLMLVVVALASLLSMVQYVTGWDLGIDQSLLKDPGGPGTIYPGRMAPLTAIAFLLISLAGIAGGRLHLGLAQRLLLLAFIIGFFSLQLLLFQGHLFLQNAGFTNVAFTRLSGSACVR